MSKKKEKIREWKRKLLEELSEKEQGMLKVNRKDIPLPPVIMDLKRRLGYPSTMDGTLLDAQDVKKTLMDILSEADRPLRIEEILSQFMKRGIRARKNTLEEIIFKFAREKSLFVKRGFVSLVRPADTKFGREVLKIIREYKSITFDELLSKIGDGELLEVILADLESLGVIVIDKTTGKIVIVS